MTLPGPEATHRWQGRTLLDRKGEPLGSIEMVYLDKATTQPEWALLEAGTTGPTPTFVPLVDASEEGNTVRVPFDKTLVGGRRRCRPAGSFRRTGKQRCTATTGSPTRGPDWPLLGRMLTCKGSVLDQPGVLGVGSLAPAGRVGGERPLTEEGAGCAEPRKSVCLPSSGHGGPG